jgi:hypothetical protein
MLPAILRHWLRYAMWAGVSMFANPVGADTKDTLPVECRTFTWELTREFALFSQAPNAIGDGPIATDTLYELELVEQSSPDDYAGWVMFRAEAPGRYRFTLNGLHRIDVEGPGGVLPAAAFQGSPACPRFRKVVEFELPAGVDLTVTVGQVTGPRARLAVTRADSRTRGD